MRLQLFLFIILLSFNRGNQLFGQVVEYQKALTHFKYHNYDSARVHALASSKNAYTDYRPLLLLAKISLLQHDTSSAKTYCDLANRKTEHVAALLLAQIAAAQQNDSLVFMYLQQVQTSNFCLSETDLMLQSWTKTLRKDNRWLDLVDLTRNNKEVAFASRCEELFKNHDYVTLDRLADSAILNSNWPSAHWFKALAWKGFGDLKIENRELLLSIKCNSSNGLYWLALARNYYESARYTKAVNALQNAISLLPDSVNLLYFKTKLLVLDKQYTQAQQEVNSLLQIEPQNDTIWYMAGMIEAEQKHTLASLPYLNRAIEINPYQAEYYKCRGNTLFDSESFELAERNFSLAMDVAPTDGTLYFNRGLCRYRMHKHQSAFFDFTRAFDLGITEAYQYISVNCKK